MMKKADSLSRLGTSKKQAREQNLKSGNGYSSPYIHGLKTLQNYKDELNRFNNYLNNNNFKFKKIEEIPREVFKSYLQSQKDRGLSPYTVHASMSCINKIFECGFTKKELGLEQRKINNITNNRGFSKSYPLLEKKHETEINFIKAFGFRRSTVNNLTPESFIRDNNGQVYALETIEKGGKINHYYLLSEYKSYINNYLDERNLNPGEKLFSNFDPYGHINTHYYRNEYSCNLYNELLENKLNNEPYYNGSPYYENYINTDKYFNNIDKIKDDTYKDYDKEIVGLLSQSLGHYRLDVVVNHYLRF